jgi:hypothetical protein
MRALTEPGPLSRNGYTPGLDADDTPLVPDTVLGDAPGLELTINEEEFSKRAQLRFDLKARPKPAESRGS